MLDSSNPDLSLFYKVIQALEDAEAPYVIIGAFAGTFFGITLATYDIQPAIDLSTLDSRIRILGEQVIELWEALKENALEASKG